MNDKPVPEFMRRYMENTGYESYLDYDRLSKEYHSELSHYHEKIHPRKMEMDNLYRSTTGARSNFDGSRELHEIEERYKSKALDIACRYGYERPENITIDQELTDIQEKGTAFGKRIDRNDFSLSHEDVRAKQAHKNFEDKNRVTADNRQQERHLIDLYYGEGRNELVAPGSKQVSRFLDSLSSEKEKRVQEKEQPEKILQQNHTRFEQKLDEFRTGKDEITQPQSKKTELDKEPDNSPENRFMKTLASERQPEQEDYGRENIDNKDTPYNYNINVSYQQREDRAPDHDER